MCLMELGSTLLKWVVFKIVPPISLIIYLPTWAYIDICIHVKSLEANFYLKDKMIIIIIMHED